jgi:hypothetical protein
MSELFEEFEYDPNFGQDHMAAAVVDHSLVKLRRGKVITRECLSSWTDEELLDTPAHVLASKLRNVANGGRDYVTAEDAPSNWAVVRVPDEEVTPQDLRPRLTWQDAIPVEPKPSSRFPVNLRVASNSIPPRVVEPELPPRTQIGGSTIKRAQVPLPPVEKALLTAAQTIQIVKKAGGRYVDLAQCLGCMWGDRELFDPDLDMDLIGDLSLSRYLAKASTRRFETLRNIGWNNLVTAGVTTATSKSYGDSATINWQRRTELAKFFLHAAMMIEGPAPKHGVHFSIAVRIPEFTVNHRTWNDLAITPWAKFMKVANMPSSLVDKAKTFLKDGLRYALRKMAVVTGRGWTELEDPGPIPVFDRLAYVRPMDFTYRATPASRAQELAQYRGSEGMHSIHGSYKAYDLRVAVLELMQSSDLMDPRVTRSMAFLQEFRRIAREWPTTSRVGLVKDALEGCQDILDYAGIVINRPNEDERRHRRAEWGRIIVDQLPAELLNDGNVYTSKVVAAGLLYDIASDPDSSASRTVGYITGKQYEVMKLGIRNQRELLVRHGDAVLFAMYRNMHHSTKSFYRERYRRRAHAHLCASRNAPTVVSQNLEYLRAACLWARADYAHVSQIEIKGAHCTIYVHDHQAMMVLAVFMGNLKRAGLKDPPMLSDMCLLEAVDATREAVVAWIGEAHGLLQYGALLDSFAKFLEEAQGDFDGVSAGITKEDLVVEPEPDNGPEAHSMDVSALNNLMGDINPENLKIHDIDEMVAHWIQVGKLYVDEDESDDLIDWIKENIDRHVSNPQDYIATYSSGLERKKAKELYEFWDDLKIQEEEDTFGGNEIN